LIRLSIPEIGEEEIAAVVDVLRSGYLVQGEKVQRFEQLVAEYVGREHAVAVSSGTAALHLALMALEIGRGDQVIVPDFTFPATANVIELAGAEPVLVDIDLATFNIDTTKIRPAITDRTKAIMPVHLFGQPADMDPILEVAQEYGLIVLEDAACALGAEYRGCKCGAMGLVGCFSFHPRKIITTGEGGMVVTNDANIAAQIRQLRNHGMALVNGYHRLEQAAFNYRMTEFQAALGVPQLRKLETIITRRAQLAELYDKALGDLSFVSRPGIIDDSIHTWQSYVILVDESVGRDRVLRQLLKSGIESTIGTYSLSAQPHYVTETAAMTNSHKAYREGLSLPLHTRMSARHIDKVVKGIERSPAKYG